MRFGTALGVLAILAGLQGCGAAVAVVDTTVGVAATAVETTVDITAGAVEGAVDLATPDDDAEN